MNKKYVILLSLPILAYISTFAVQGKQTLLQQTIEHNNIIYAKCFWTSSIWGTWTDTEKYRQSTDCWKSQRKLTPDDLFLTVPKYLVDEGKCAISQSEDDHVRPERGGMYATDIACKFESQGVYAPDYLNDMKEYIIEEVWYDKLLWNFVILAFKSEGQDSWNWLRWYFGHTVLQWWFKKGDTIQTWTRFGKADLSGATTWSHTHIELRTNIDGVQQSIRYATRWKERKLEQTRLESKSQTGVENTYYFTSYDLWDKSQNDNAPCISADGKDSCALSKSWRGTMALTVDIRKKLRVNFGDKVVLQGDVWCEWVYTVTDEMACRFRGENAWDNGRCNFSDWTPTPKVSHIKRPGTPYVIKGDLPGRPGGACSIKKL